MKIYGNYTTLNLLLNEPCKVGDCVLYPILVNEYTEFQLCSSFLTANKRILKLPDEASLLQHIIYGSVCSVMGVAGGMLDFTNPKTMEAIDIVLNSFSKCFSLVTKKKIIGMANMEGGFYFTDEENTITINDENYEDIRFVIMSMTLMREPKIFEDEVSEKWYYKSLIAQQKNGTQVEYEDIIVALVQDMKWSFKEIAKLNIFQLYSLYYRIQHIQAYETTRLFSTVSAKPLPPVQFAEGLIQKMFEVDDSGLYTSLDGISNMF